MEAAMRQGKKVADWNVCSTIAAQAAGLLEDTLLAKARSAEIEKRVRASTAAFHALQVDQRPTFVLDSNIGDRAVFSGFWRLAPLAAAIESMLADATAYDSWKAHFGDPAAA
jgi:predicted DsbA family dithiol-disulfide isomerase